MASPLFAFLFSVAVITTSGQQAFAQKTEKIDKKTQIALEERYRKDKAYAETKRSSFNRTSWIGSKLSDLIASWGPPTRVTTDGGDGQIVIYENTSYNSGGQYTPGTITTATNGFGQTVVVGTTNATDTRWASQYWESTAVYVDKDKVIIKVDYKNDRKTSGNTF